MFLVYRLLYKGCYQAPEEPPRKVEPTPSILHDEGEYRQILLEPMRDVDAHYWISSRRPKPQVRDGVFGLPSRPAPRVREGKKYPGTMIDQAGRSHYHYRVRLELKRANPSSEGHEYMERFYNKLVWKAEIQETGEPVTVILCRSRWMYNNAMRAARIVTQIPCGHLVQVFGTICLPHGGNMLGGYVMAPLYEYLPDSCVANVVASPSTAGVAGQHAPSFRNGRITNLQLFLILVQVSKVMVQLESIGWVHLHPTLINLMILYDGHAPGHKQGLYSIKVAGYSSIVPIGYTYGCNSMDPATYTPEYGTVLWNKGRKTVRGDTLQSTLTRALEQVPGVPAKYIQLMRSCTEPVPSARPPTEKICNYLMNGPEFSEERKALDGYLVLPNHPTYKLPKGNTNSKIRQALFPNSVDLQCPISHVLMTNRRLINEAKVDIPFDALAKEIASGYAPADSPAALALAKRDQERAAERAGSSITTLQATPLGTGNCWALQAILERRDGGERAESASSSTANSMGLQTNVEMEHDVCESETQSLRSTPYSVEHCTPGDANEFTAVYRGPSGDFGNLRTDLPLGEESASLIMPRSSGRRWPADLLKRLQLMGVEEALDEQQDEPSSSTAQKDSDKESEKATENASERASAKVNENSRGPAKMLSHQYDSDNKQNEWTDDAVDYNALPPDYEMTPEVGTDPAQKCCSRELVFPENVHFAQYVRTPSGNTRAVNGPFFALPPLNESYLARQAGAQRADIRRDRTRRNVNVYANEEPPQMPPPPPGTDPDKPIKLPLIFRRKQQTYQQTQEWVKGTYPEPAENDTKRWGKPKAKKTYEIGTMTDCDKARTAKASDEF